MVEPESAKLGIVLCVLLWFTVSGDGKVSEVEDGVSELENEVSELEDGISELEDRVSELENGISDLRDEVLELEDGVSEPEVEVSEIYREEGVSEVCIWVVSLGSCSV